MHAALSVPFYSLHAARCVCQSALSGKFNSTIARLTLVFDWLIEATLERLHRVFVPARFKSRFPAAHKDVLSFREMDSQRSHKVVERPRLVLDVGMVLATVKKTVQRGWPWGEIVRVVKQGDDELADVDNLDAMRKEGAIGIAHVYRFARKVQDRGLILCEPVSQMGHVDAGKHLPQTWAGSRWRCRSPTARWPFPSGTLCLCA